MADTYPTLGLNIDLAQLDATRQKLEGVRQSYKDLGTAAVESGQQATKAAAGQADAYQKALNQIAADAQRVTSFRMNLIRQETAEVRAAANAEIAAIASVTAQRESAYRAWTAASQTANAKMLSDTLSRLTSANQEEYLSAVYAVEQQQKSAAAQAAATAARVQAEMDSENLIAVYRTEAQIKRMRDAQEAAAYETQMADQSAAAQIAAATAAAEARQTALAQDRSSYEAWWALMASQPAQSGVTTIAGTEADIAAREADVAAMVRQQQAGQAYVAQLNEQAATLGMTRAEIAAYRAEQLGVTAEAAASIAIIAQTEQHIGGTSTRIREMIVLLREFGRGDFSRMAGSASILLGTFVAITTEMVVMAATAAAIAAPFILLAKAMNDGAAETDKLNNLLRATGNYADVTSGQFYGMAQTIAAATDTGIGKAEKTLMELVAAGQLTGFQLQSVGLAATQLAVLTGQSADKVAKSMADMVTKPTEGALKLEEQYHALTAAQFEHIAMLEREGDRQGAFNALMDDLNAKLAGQAQQLGPLGGLIHGIGEMWDGAWNAAKRYGDFLINGPTRDAAIYALQQQIAAAQASKAPLHDPTQLAFGRDDLATMIAKRDALIQQGQAANKAAQDSQVSTRGVEAISQLDSAYRSLGGSAALAAQEIEGLHQRMRDAQAAYAVSPTPELKAHLDELSAHMPQMEAAIRKKYDRGDLLAQRQSLQAQGPIAKAQADVTSLGDQLGNLNPSVVADAMAKIQDAYDKAFVAFDKTTNAYKQGTAEQYAGLMADKERLTIWNQLANAADKQTLAEQERGQAIRVATDYATQAAGIMAAYYQDGTVNLDAFGVALQAQSVSQVQAKNAQADYAIAAQYGATSVNGIAAALIAAVPPTMLVTDLMRQQAQATQQHAQNLLDATVATNEATQSSKDLSAAQQQAVDTLSNVQGIGLYIDALRAGIAAMADFTRTQAIMAAMRTNGGNAQAATFKVDSETVANAAKLTAEFEDQSRLAGMSAHAREAEKLASIQIAALLAQTGTSYEKLDRATQDRLKAEAGVTAQMQLQQQALANLQGSLQDSIRAAFISGNFDFSNIGDAVEKELRRAIYDAFLAKPIEIAVKAEVEAISGLEKLATDFLNKIPGLGGAGTALAQAYGSGQAGSQLAGMFGFQGNSNKTAQTIANTMAAAVGNALGGPVGGAIASAITTIIGSVIGPKPSNFTATASFNGLGYVTGGDKPNANTSSAIDNVAQNVAQEIAALQRLGINAAGVIQNMAIGQRDPSKITFSNGQVGLYGVGDPAALLKGATQGLLQFSTTQNNTQRVLIDQMMQANSSFSDISNALQTAADAMKQLRGKGIGGDLTQAEIALIESGKSGASADIVGARMTLSDLQTAMLQYSDPQAYAVAQLKANQTQRRSDIQNYVDEGLLTPDQAAAIESTLKALEDQELASTLSQFNSAIQTAAQSTQDMVAAQKQLIAYIDGLNTSSLSPLSPTDQLKYAQDQFNHALAAAQNGDAAAMGSLSTLAQQYLQEAQSYFASSAAYANIFQTVEDELNAIAHETFKYADNTASGSSASVAGTPSSTYGSVADAASQSTTSTIIDPNQIALITGSLSGIDSNLAQLIQQLLDQGASNSQLLQSIIAWYQKSQYGTLLSGGTV